MAGSDLRESLPASRARRHNQHFGFCGVFDFLRCRLPLVARSNPSSGYRIPAHLASEYTLNGTLHEVNAMARIRGVDPSKQRLLNRLFTRIVYVMTKRKVGRVVMPVQLVSHHPRLLWGYGQMEQSFASSHLVGADLKDLATLLVATLVGCPF